MIKLSRDQFDTIVAHARSGFPNEICGILAGRDGQVEIVHQARNVARTPRTRFSMDPQDILGITDAIDEAGMDLLGFYHSHTHTQAYPSPTDVSDWPAHWYPDALCLICSLMEEDRPQLRAFHIDAAGEIEEADVEIA
ncbi:MAG: M67 family metallopeptidase [Chloroflexi bacterium]|nr:M67 family metallopeptidase [Chloroflexota bacterium]